MPGWKKGQRRFFNIQPAMTLRRHQFAFHSGGNDKNLFSYSADINSAMLKSTTMFRCFKCFLNENQSIVAMWSSVVSSSWPSICDSVNRGFTLTVVLALPTSRIYLKTTLFITCQDPLAEEVDLLLSHAKGFMFREMTAVFFLSTNILI